MNAWAARVRAGHRPTPLRRIEFAVAEVVLKDESAFATGSTEQRSVAAMFRHAIASGRITEGSQVMVATACAVAVAAARSRRCSGSRALRWSGQGRSRCAAPDRGSVRMLPARRATAADCDTRLVRSRSAGSRTSSTTSPTPNPRLPPGRPPSPTNCSANCRSHRSGSSWARAPARPPPRPAGAGTRSRTRRGCAPRDWTRADQPSARRKLSVSPSTPRSHRSCAAVAISGRPSVTVPNTLPGTQPWSPLISRLFRP